MADFTNRNESFKVVYNSDLIIRDRAEAATLCVFYDKVFLPYTTPQSRVRLTGLSGTGQVEKLEYRDDIEKWELEYRALFDSGVLSRLPTYKEECEDIDTVEIFEKPYFEGIPIPNDIDQCLLCKITDEGNEQITHLTHLTPWGTVQDGDEILHTESAPAVLYFPSGRRLECAVKHSTVRRRVVRTREKDIVVEPEALHSIRGMPIHGLGSDRNRYIKEDLVKHILRSDIEMPQIFRNVAGRPCREVLVALEAEATFSYLLPKLCSHRPGQILELREKVAATREGFTMHLWKLSKDLEGYARDGVSANEIARFARNLIETDLIPDYREFRRQFKAMDARSLNKILDVAGKVAEIDATVWTPKFFGLLLKALGLTALTTASEEAERRSNKYQAFMFMSELERG